LKIANATESIPTKARNVKNPKFSNNFSENFTTPTGQVKELRASFASQDLKEKIFLPKVPNEDIVKFHSPFISFNPANIAPPNQNFIGSISKFHS